MYRTNLVTFCGSDVSVELDVNGICGKECFNNYENGVYKFREKMKTRHPNILKSVLIAKKGWRLWVNEWSEGISDGLFTKEEILEEFKSKQIELPESFIKELDDTIWKMKKSKWGCMYQGWR
jgi:hypothetical protein